MSNSNDNNNNNDFINSVQRAFDSADFDGMRRAVEDALSVAGEAIKSGVGQAADAASQAINSASEAAQRAHREQQDKQEIMRAEARDKAILSSRFSPSGSKTASGVLLIIIGVIITATFAVALGDAIDDLVLISSLENIITTIICGGLTVTGAGLIWIGARKMSLASAFKKYKSIIGLRESCQISQIARMTGDSEDHVVSNIKRMIAQRLFKQAHLDANNTHVMMTDAAHGRYLESRAAEIEVARKNEEAARAAQAEASQKQAHMDSFNSSQIAMLNDGERYIKEIRDINAQIPGAEISAKISRIEFLTQKILERAREHPEVIDDLQKMMDYYLPTTVKLLETYRDLDEQPVQGETIAKSKAEIDAALDTLNNAFERLLDSIFKSAAWDVSTDITVLHAMLAQEGLIGDDIADAASGRSRRDDSKPSVEAIEVKEIIIDESDDSKTE